MTESHILSNREGGIAGPNGARVPGTASWDVRVLFHPRRESALDERDQRAQHDA
jgi:hypothetical protein